MSLFQVTKKQTIEGYELRTMTGDIVSFTPSYSQLLPDPFSDLNVTVNVLATGGNGTPDNPNPINGYSSANITRCGKNIFNYDLSDATNAIKYVQIKTGNGTFTMSSNAPLVEGAAILFFLNGYQTSGVSTAVNGVSNGIPRTVTTTDGYVTFAYRYYGVPTVYPADYNIQLEKGSTASAYAPFNGQTCTIAFGQTVYGGVLDVTRGKLHVTHNFFDMGDVNWVREEDAQTPGIYYFRYLTSPLAKQGSICICSCYETYTGIGVIPDINIKVSGAGQYVFIRARDDNYTDATTFKASVTGQRVVYELSTPFDIDLTPEVISAIVGVNNVFADCGNVTVTCLI